MKKYIKAAVLAVLVTAAAVLAVNAVKGIASPEEKLEAPTDIISADSKAEFYLRDCDGLVAVFRSAGSSRPIEVTDIETETLSRTDRELLKKGIPAANKYELICLLEDFSS